MPLKVWIISFKTIGLLSNLLIFFLDLPAISLIPGQVEAIVFAISIRNILRVEIKGGEVVASLIEEMERLPIGYLIILYIRLRLLFFLSGHANPGHERSAIFVIRRRSDSGLQLDLLELLSYFLFVPFLGSINERRAQLGLSVAPEGNRIGSCCHYPYDQHPEEERKHRSFRGIFLTALWSIGGLRARVNFHNSKLITDY